MDIYYLKGIMSLDKGNNLPIAQSIELANKFSQVQLKMDEENHHIFYECNVNDILASEITNEDLIQLRCEGGWEYDETSNKLLKKI